MNARFLTCLIIFLDWAASCLGWGLFYYYRKTGIEGEAFVATKAFYLGILDLFADMELSQALIQVDNPLIHQLLSQFILTSKALGVKPVSFVFQEYRDDTGFQAWLELEKKMGFDAKGCLSPKQVQQVQNTFGVDKEAIIRAQYIVERFEEQREQGVTGFSDDRYGFIDEPIYKGALALIK